MEASVTAASDPVAPHGPVVPTPTVPASTAGMPTDLPEQRTESDPHPESQSELQPEPQFQPELQPDPELQLQPEPDREPEPVLPAARPVRPDTGPRVRAVLVDPPAGARPELGAVPPKGPDTRPRLGAVPPVEPSRSDAAARRRSVPTVRAVRLTAEPAGPTRRPAPAPAAVTPVPLPLPLPRTVTRDEPTESRTEEPQP
ncbi:hypothetical protein ACFXGT_25540 [Streptomyces sp. NPDC059352]|uniref:hypothetical protein n=1 Tax=Streptomyces sp. NPDC059352 TaxID=3346810 RepID=UPI0036CBEEAB